MDSFVSWKPNGLVAEFKNNRGNKDIQLKYLKHITNIAASTHWKQESDLTPSSYLDAAVSSQQQRMLNPKFKDCILGFTIYDVKGKGAVQKIAKRRLEFIEGNVASYSRLLNDEARLDAIKEMNQLVSAVAEVSADKEKAKQKRKESTAEKELQKDASKNAAEQAEAAKMEERLPQLKEIMACFDTVDADLVSLKGFNCTVLKEIIKYYYQEKPVGLSSWSKQTLVLEVSKRIVIRWSRQESNTI